MKLSAVIADKKERHFLKGIVSVGGYYSCESCKAKGRHRGGMSWPLPHSIRGEMRTHEEHKDIAR